ncbi:ParB/RepB/Spo0J family partition protein [Patescibacteria group bacterium]|nr:ParB/RepB/Spo0J family partition protein [Patescibacteria group bacterium]MBU4512272.1 ParB/RepB/Spo0J family partition protein [Patescibacteria group bacterium]MCG2693272.1 ParB/RepB/Spo0J family partition protein [Candidatus Parcubacteria bacterium]
MSNGLGRGLASLIPAKNQTPSGAGLKEEGPSDVRLGERVYQISPGKIKPNSLQPRKIFDNQAMKDLADSIKQHGILEPLIATEEPNGIYQLIAGERRLRASQELGLKTVPVILRTGKQMERLELSLIENIQRQDLNPLERAQAYAQLLEEFGLTQEELGKRVGKGRTVIANALRLLKLPDEAKKALLEGKIFEGHARAVLSLDNKDKQLLFLNQILEKKFSANEAEMEAARVSKKKIVRRGVTDPNVLEKEERLQSALGTRVRIRKKGGRGMVMIEFYSDEELAGIVERITRGGD